MCGDVPATSCGVAADGGLRSNLSGDTVDDINPAFPTIRNVP